MKSEHMLLLSLILWVLTFSTCDSIAPFSDDEVITPWEYMKDKIANADTVVITDVQPKGAAARTATVFTIYGKNFQANVDSVKVYFNSTPVKVISATTDSIKVYRPKISGDNLTVKVVCHDRINVAHFAPIAINEVVTNFGTFVGAEYIKDLTFDKDSNLYVYISSSSDFLAKFVYPSQVRAADWTGILKTYAPTDLKMEQGKIAYACGINVILRVGADGSDYTANRKDVFGGTVKVRRFDYNVNHDIYAGGINAGIIRVTADGATKTTYNFYSNTKIMALRVYDGYVYVIANPITSPALAYGVYRNQIKGDGSLGDPELVLNWEALRPSVGSDLNDLTFSASGVLYLGCSDPHAPLMRYQAGRLEPVYYDIVGSPVSEMEWSPDGYLYVIVKNTETVEKGCRIQRVDIGEQGAPYYGRE